MKREIIIKGYGKLTSKIKSCVDVEPDADFYETMIP